MVLVLFLVPFSFFIFFVNTSVRFGFLQAGSPKILWELGWPYVRRLDQSENHYFQLSAAAISGVFGAVLCVTILVTSVLIIVFILGKKENSVAERNVMITCLTFAVSAASISLYQVKSINIIISFRGVFSTLNRSPWTTTLQTKSSTIVVRLLFQHNSSQSTGVVVDIAALLPSWSLLITSSQVRRSLYERNSVISVHAVSTGSNWRHLCWE